MGKYYRLDRSEKNQIIFLEEPNPQAHTPYIILPNEDFSIELGKEMEGSLSDTVSVNGVLFIGSYRREELTSESDYYIDIIDITPDCQVSENNPNQFVIGALHAYLKVTWDDPYSQGPTRGVTRKRAIVLQDNPNGIGSLTPNPSPREGGAIYDLSGRKINSQFSTFNSQFRKKGLYIKDGKKIIVK